MRSRNIFNPDPKVPFKLSRSKLEDFTRCPRCFYLDRRLGVGRPSMPSFNLNSAVDTLFKKEFDVHRANGTPHPLMEHYKINAVPFQHPKLNEWRQNFQGIQVHHPLSNFIFTGAVDDIWVTPDNQLHVVDYKSTANENGVSLDGMYKDGYKRQIEIYQWLFRASGFDVSNIGYFVYANGRTDRKAFDGKLEFDIEILPYTGDDSWVEPSLLKARDCLESNTLPESAPDCEHCTYRKESKEVEK